MDISTKAVAHVTLEVEVGDGWSKDCSIHQVSKQAADSAKEIVRGATTGCDRIKIKRVSIASIVIESQE